MIRSHRTEAISFFLELPSHTLDLCVLEAGIVSSDDLARLRKELPEDAFAARLQFVETLVDMHIDAGADRSLVDAAARHVHQDPHQQFRLQRFLDAVLKPASSNPDQAKQAVIARRDHTLPLDQMGRFFQDISGKLCLVVAAKHAAEVSLGTGVLIGPDLILTSYHLLKGHIEDGKQEVHPHAILKAVFDYHGTQPFDLGKPRPPGTVEVAFADRWLVAHSKDMPEDGLFRTPDAEQLGQLPTRLDFAVVRLADPIGLRPRVPVGGPRRLWCEFPKTARVPLAEQCVIIPQHPHGWPRRVSIGRYCATSTAFDTSNTRLRYNCDTDKGTSGAPCFDSQFELIGMHNATFAPDRKVEANQAIRAQPILAALGNLIDGDHTLLAIPLWNASPDPAKPRPVFGRRKLLQWIEQASDDHTAPGTARCYVAREASDEPQGGSGLSFSAEILTAARSGAGSEEPVIVLGAAQRLPETARDFMCTLANHLRIDSAHVLDMPQRPSAAGAPEGVRIDTDLDKVNKWLGHDLPQWLNRALGSTPEGVSGDEEEPRFRRVWIVVDGLHRRPLAPEVEDLIAGLMSGADQSGFLSNLACIRWVFLGQAPRPALSPSTTVETLHPFAVEDADMEIIAAALGDSHGWSAETVQAVSLLFSALFSGPLLDDAPPALRLQRLQAHVAAAITKVSTRLKATA